MTEARRGILPRFMVQNAGDMKVFKIVDLEPQRVVARGGWEYIKKIAPALNTEGTVTGKSVPSIKRKGD